MKEIYHTVFAMTISGILPDSKWLVKGCPMCDNGPILELTIQDQVLKCIPCGLMMHQNSKKPLEKLILKWNRRISPKLTK